MTRRMKFFRSPALMALFFGLLTLGQAYPFSVAWGLSKQTHPCCCSSDTSMPCHCNHSHGKFKCHKEEDKSPSYKQSPCGRRTMADSLDFKGDAFLPKGSFTGVVLLTPWYIDVFVPSHPKFRPLPESPPPRT